MILPMKPIISKIICKLTNQPYIPSISKGLPTHYICSYPINFGVKQLIDEIKNNDCRDTIVICSDDQISFTPNGEGDVDDLNSSNNGCLTSNENSSAWFSQGEKCEILRAGSSGWDNGKIKINVTLEFIPDESEEAQSPLDDIRQETIQSNNEQN